MHTDTDTDTDNGMALALALAPADKFQQCARVCARCLHQCNHADTQPECRGSSTAKMAALPQHLETWPTSNTTPSAAAIKVIEEGLRPRGDKAWSRNKLIKMETDAENERRDNRKPLEAEEASPTRGRILSSLRWPGGAVRGSGCGCRSSQSDVHKPGFHLPSLLTQTQIERC
jgi:hypothetical protein